MVLYDLFNDLAKKETSLHFTVAGNDECNETDCINSLDSSQTL